MRIAALAFTGGAVGLVLKFYTTIKFRLLYEINFAAILLMRTLRALSMPFICSSVIRAAASLPPLNTRNKIRLLHAVSTTLISTSIGVMMVAWLIPGLNIPAAKPFFRLHAVGELLWSLVYGSPMRMQYHTYRDKAASSLQMLHSKESLEKQFLDWPNHISVIMLSLLIGLFMRNLNEPNTTPLITVAMHECTKLILRWTYYLLYVAGVTHSMADMYNADWSHVIKLFNFVGVVLLGLVIHGCVLLPLLYLATIRKNPLTLMKRLLSSTRAALLFSFYPPPELLRRGTAMELMNGTALYGAAVVLFITKFHSLQVEMPQFCNMFLALVITCNVGTDGIPSTGSLTTFFLLSFLGLPLNTAGVLLIVEVPLRIPIYVVNRLSAEIGKEVADRYASDVPQDESSGDLQFEDCRDTIEQNETAL